METRILLPELLKLKVHLTSTLKNTFTAGRSRSSESPPLLTVSHVKRERSESLELESVCENVKQFKADSDHEAEAEVTPRRARRLRKSHPQSRARIQRVTATGRRLTSESRARSSLERETNEESESEAEYSESNTEVICPVKRGRAVKHNHKSEGSRNGVVQKVQICARGRISAGTRLDPKDGRFKVLMLDEHATEPGSEGDDEVRSIFGCFDRFIEDPSKPGERIRLCSWMKFVSSSPSLNSAVNLVAKFVERSPVLEFSQGVDAGEEIVAFFDLESVHRSIGQDSVRFGINFNVETSETHVKSKMYLKEGPLDLSGGKSPDSHKSFASQSHSSGSSRPSPSSPNANDHSTPKRTRSRSSSPTSSISLSPCPSSNEDSPSLSQGRRIKHKPVAAATAANGSSIFSIRNVLQMQSSASASSFFQPHLLNSSNTKASNSNSHPEQLILTPPLSSSTTNATATALSSPADSNRSLLSSPSGCGSNPKISPYEPHATARHKLTHSNLHAMLSQYGFNAGLGSGGTGSALTAAGSGGAPSLLRPILRTRGRERSLLPCEVCNKAFDRPSLLKRHMRTHTGEKPHVCDTCGKGFSTSSSLNTHRRIHSGEKPHQCPICGKRFTASSNLYYHRMTHNKEKPHKCLLCGKSFPTPGDLKSHQYVHSGSWPFSCRICNRGFSKQTNLRNHLLLHSGDKPHACRICNKKFALACNLRAHLRTHEEDSLSTCVSCKRSFVNSSNMVVDGQCRICATTAAVRSSKMNAKLPGGSGSLFPTHFAPITSMDVAEPEERGRRVSPSKFHPTGTLTSNITIPQPPSTSTTAAPSSGLERNRSSSPESNSRKELHRKLPVLNNFGHPLAAFHGLQHAYHPLHNLQESPSSASTSLAAIASGHGHGHQFQHPFLDHLHQLQLGGPNFAPGRPNPFLEQLFEWNLRVAKETVGSLGLMQQKLLESQMLAAQLMSNPTGLSDLLRIQAGVSVGGQGGRGIPTSNHDFSNVSGRLGLLDDKK